MQHKSIIKILFFFLLISWRANGYSFEYQNADVKLYNNAKKEFLDQNWGAAIELFQKLIDEFPDSNYQDDALFWLGYCFERKPGGEMEAFLTFDRLSKNMPNSPWSDDATIHQINLAEKFIRDGKKQYLDFLIKKFDEGEEIKRQAAIALGKFADKRALPILEQIKDDETLGLLAKSLITQIKSEKTAETKLPDQPKLSTNLEITHPLPENKMKSNSSKSTWDFPLLLTKRHQHYQKILKKDDDWSKDELIDFAMWQILSTNQFEEYFALEGYDRQEWLRKFWKKRDPTPTTEENECEDEFMNRINYARAHFSDFWNYQQFEYLMDQYLRQGWEHAPWDARGELYIKYGQPDFRSIVDFHKEEWSYWKYNVDFMINQYMTNIYGNAIAPGPMSQLMYRESPGYVEFNFIYKPEFRYHHDYKSNPIKNFVLAVADSHISDYGNALIKYSVDPKEFKILANKANYLIKYFFQYVVFDADMREVYRKEEIKEISKATKQEFKKEKNIEGNIELALKPGEYLFALKIEDQNSDKLGIYVKDFKVKK